jgi:hypothetical protein
MRPWLWLLGAPLALALSGCGRLGEISACRALAREVNPTLDQIEALSKQPGADAEERMAQQYLALSKRVAPHAAGNSTLAAAVKDYAAVLESTGKALRSHADSVRAGAGPRTNEPRRELDRLVKRERTATARIEAECHG